MPGKVKTAHKKTHRQLQVLDLHFRVALISRLSLVVLLPAIRFLPSMTYQLLGVAAVAAIIFLVKLSESTDIPKIKNLPAIPGVPIFGNLIQLGTDHARVAAKWAKKYGPVFQTRLGTKVSRLFPQN